MEDGDENEDSVTYCKTNLWQVLFWGKRVRGKTGVGKRVRGKTGALENWCVGKRVWENGRLGKPQNFICQPSLPSQPNLALDFQARMQPSLPSQPNSSLHAHAQSLLFFRPSRPSRPDYPIYPQSDPPRQSRSPQQNPIHNDSGSNHMKNHKFNTASQQHH